MNQAVDALRSRSGQLEYDIDQLSHHISCVKRDEYPEAVNIVSRREDELAKLTAERRDIDELLAAWDARPARCPACQTLLHNAKCPSPFCEADTGEGGGG